MTALALPPLMVVSLGAVQLQSVFNDKNKAQDIADAAALWGAQQLTVTPVGADERTKSFADAEASDMKANATVTITAAVVGPSTMKVSIDTYRPSFFFNLLPAGGFYTHAESVAEGVSQTPLCVMTFGTDTGDKLEVTASSQMKAPACLIHANENIRVDGGALLQADTVETGASASGPISPSASTGAPDVSDPFASLDLTPGLLSCLLTPLADQLFTSGSTLAPGCHGKVEVKNGQTLTLQPGEHYFQKDFNLKESASLVGDDVVLIFGKDGKTDWKDGASVNLTGRQTGSLAGFVIVTTRDHTAELKINSDPIRKMTGTIYVPNARLNIEGSLKTSEASDWTVMAVEALRLTNKPVVQINADYAGSSVPVPSGVGNKSKSTYTHITG